MLIITNNSGTLSMSGGTSTSSISSTGGVGSGTAFDIRDPYKAMYIWQRTS